MPRDGSGIYVKPFPDVVEGTTIESTVHNGEISDIEYDLNTPRPIVAGGTGANNAHDAMIALSGEIAGQVVTNYDTFPFVDGDFYSLPGATAAPISDYITGICYGCGAGINAPTLEARCMTTAGTPVYVRTKVSGVWSAWKLQPGSVADLDAAYVNVAGDTMTGDLGISKGNGGGTGPTIALSNNSGAGGDAAEITFTDGSLRGSLRFGIDRSPYGADLVYSTGNGTLTECFRIRTDGIVNVPLTTASSSPTTGALTVAGGVGVGGALHADSFTAHGVSGLTLTGTVTPAISFVPSLGATSNAVMYQNGDSVVMAGAANFLIANPATGDIPLLGGNGATNNVNIPSTKASTSTATGALTVAGGLGVAGGIQASFVVAQAHMQVGSAGAAGTLYFGNQAAGAKFIGYDGANFSLSGGATALGAEATASNHATTKNYVDTRPGAIRAAALIDVFGGRGFSMGVASTSDSGIGFTDANYNFLFSTSVNNCPTAAIYCSSTNQSCTMGNPSVGAIRLHSVTASTGALTDPQYYCFHATGA